jgi:hypothetical protein
VGGWRKLHIENLHNSCFSPDVRIMKSRRIRWPGHLARMGRIDKPKMFCQENRKEEYHLEYLGIDG